MRSSRSASERTKARMAATVSACVFLLLLLAPGSAAAAPSFEVQLSRQASEVQSVHVLATAGQFRLCFEGACTPDLDSEASAATVQAALNALPSISVGGGAVSVDSFRTGLYVITFNGGPRANTDVPELTAAPAATPLSGGLERVTIFTAYPSGVSRSDRQLGYTLDVKNAGSSATAGAVTAEVSLPAGLQTSVFAAEGPGWTCATQPPGGIQPARAICTSSEVLAAGASSTLTVVASLGADAPDHAVATAVVSGGGAATAGGEDEFDFAPARPFAIEALSTEVDGLQGSNYTQAGGHPFAASVTIVPTTFKSFSNDITYHEVSEPIKSIVTDLPRGFVGNALSVPQVCNTLAEVLASTCPEQSAVGVIGVDITLGGGELLEIPMVIYAIKSEFGSPAQFAFSENANLNSSYTLTARLRPNEGYAISLDATPSAISPPIRHINYATLCDFGAKLKREGGVFGSTVSFESCKQPSDPTANPVPLITNPTRCAGPAPTTTVHLDSWEHPGASAAGGGPDLSDPNWKSASFLGLPLTGCPAVAFEPKARLEPTNHQADSPSGLSVEITTPTAGLESDTGIAQADLDTAKVTLPKGMSINPATANGLEACSEAQIGLGNNSEATCPESSKVGTIEIQTPLLDESLQGGIYVAKQSENPFKSTLGLYMAFASKKNGVIIKIAGKLVPDPVTGQLTAIFTESPEDPFSKLVLHFNEGPRAPLVNPPACGTYAIHSELSPWSAANPAEPTPAETASEDSDFVVSEGPGGASCPTVGLEPKLKAGLESPAAGAMTPFVLDLSREDGTQRFTGLDLTLPKGLLAHLAGVPYCPDSVLASIPSAEGTGRAELANQSCPEASQVGTVEVAAGSGPDPFHTHGWAYFAGPYKGAPFSIAIVMPAVAGPFDLGNVVVRSGLYVDPQTAEVTVKSDPIPTILDGILLDVRDIHVDIDRPGFIVAPTNCEVMAVGAQVAGEQGASGSASSRFQVGGCAKLAFKPVFKAASSAKTASRANGAALTVELSQLPGEANIHRVKVELPKALPSRLTTLQKACTEEVFARNPAECPAASAVGMAVARTPILPVALAGPAYFVSHGGAKFPELVLVLQGDGVTIDLYGETFISKHGVTSSTFATVPDAPVSSFELSLPQGKYSALAANGNLCAKKLVMPTEMVGQNGIAIHQSTPIEVAGCSTALSVTSHRVSKRKLTLSVYAPAAGKLKASGKGLKTVSMTAKGRETLKLTIPATKHGKFSTTVRVSFAPTGGKTQVKNGPITKTLKVSFEAAKPARKKHK